MAAPHVFFDTRGKYTATVGVTAAADGLGAASAWTKLEKENNSKASPINIRVARFLWADLMGFSGWWNVRQGRRRKL
jgi:hypothetical protein